MIILLYFLIGSAFFSAAALATSWYAGRERRNAVRRLSQMTRKQSRASRDNALRQQEGIATLAARFQEIRGRLGLTATWEGDVRSRLTRAGFRNAKALDVYCLVRVLTPLIGALMAALVQHNRCPSALLSFAAFYLLNDMVLLRLGQRRQSRIQRSLPDAVDLLVICVDAGLGLDQALARVSQELGVSHPEITGEFLLVGLEQRAGKPRLQAWQALAERVKLPDIQSFVSMLMQTERFGTPIAKALSSFAGDMRGRRNQHAEEMAAKTTVKVVFPLVFCILPSMFIVLLGPAVITLLRNLTVLSH